FASTDITLSAGEDKELDLRTTLSSSEFGGTVEFTTWNAAQATMEMTFPLGFSRYIFIMWEGLLGNGDGTFSQAEADMLEDLIGEEVDMDGIAVFTVDGIAIYSTNEHTLSLGNLVGSCIRDTPLSLSLTLSLAPYETIAASTTHTLDVGMEHLRIGSDLEDAAQHMTFILPDSFSLVEFEIQGSGEVMVSGSSTITLQPLENNMRYEWIALVVSSEGGNSVPVASIDLISPEEAMEGDFVLFEGTAKDADGTVVEYLWRSSIDGEISTQSSFSTSDLSAGTHTIYFLVKDDKDIWSHDATATVTITEYIAPTLPELSVKLSANPSTILGGMNSTLTIQVWEGGDPMTGAWISLVSAGGGSFTTPVDSGDGTYSTVFRAPEVIIETTCAVTVTATKTGYAKGQQQLALRVSPLSPSGTLSVVVSANPATVISGNTTTLIVQVWDSTSPMAGADLAPSSDGGGSFSTPVDNGDGTYAITYTPDAVASPTVYTVAVTATKTG
ncbi:MAG: hypothetical protein KAT70_06930, partial [Thermoplasmata archaeon]|nr:hypothetical protein [Thermoplasmata archaeon]